MSRHIVVRGSGEHQLLWMWCPGCEGLHAIREGTWEWNGDVDSPTISPSILVTQQFRHPDFTDRRCHSFVRDGQWQFLSDCTHALAGQTVPFVPVPDDLLEYDV